MKYIVIDAREACLQNRAGKAEWAFNFIRELSIRADVHCILLTNTSNVPLEFTQLECIQLPTGYKFHVAVRTFLKKHPDYFFVAPTSFIAPLLCSFHVHIIVIIHDLIAWRPEPHSLKARIIERVCLPLLLKRNSIQVCTVSESTKKDLEQSFPAVSGKVHVIYAGPKEYSPKLALSDKSYLFCVGTLCPRKNQLRLLQAFSRLPEEIQAKHPLIIAGGRGWHDEVIFTLATTLPHVTYVGYISNEEYISYLHHCYALVYPSLYEGFGLQVLDALQRGVPVLTSAQGSLFEVAGEAAYIVDPTKVEDIQAGLLAICTNSDLREKLKKKGPIQAATFNWKHTVDLFLEQLK